MITPMKKFLHPVVKSKKSVSVVPTETTTTKKKPKTRRGLFFGKHQKTRDPLDETIRDFSGSETEGENAFAFTENGNGSSSLYCQAVFCDELEQVRSNSRITKVTLRDFINRYERDDILTLQDLLRFTNRSWKSIKFEDTIQGTNYRRWQFRKDNLCRVLNHAFGNDEFTPCLFYATLEIDMNVMSRRAIISLLKELPKDSSITSIKFTGCLAHQDIEAIVGILLLVLRLDDRRWKGVVFRATFDSSSSDYTEWVRKMSKAKKHLEEIAAKQNIPIGVHAAARRNSVPEAV